VIVPEPYRARPARREDLDDLVELFEARDLVDVGFVDQAREEILEDWASPTLDFASDTTVVKSPQGAIAAYGVVLVNDPDVQVFAVGKVHPSHVGRGLGAAILAEQERRARRLIGTGVRAPLRTIRPETDVAAHGLARSCGYAHVRSSWLMERALPAPDVAGPDPDGITFRLGSARDEPSIHAVLESAFEQHFGYERTPYEQWARWVRASPGYDPALAVLALSGDRPVGVSVNLAALDGAGWIGDLGVLEGFRRRGIASALLARSFETLSAAGHHEVRLGVDSENATGATRLYEGVGMTVRRRFDLYEKQLTGA
jgi:ribosomal protein S18 acetylase RimI-like enzyme